ncbi:D-amino-acid dehydrogenase [Pseudochelatococcus lubricantis]|uniref:D-amino-acid dehydrogenase n=1 Tax=Pseudochelatococcus lubricantis TaxID=1538102 RepID=A0ABX0V0J3_9HYPH|nr:D-amino acid dehydrogenase [Pseudochelatococcus lubricantis]NIJ58064.1 D-amino-acid dehydrogenase [Pseudochelatococcus lubricantis]
MSHIAIVGAGITGVTAAYSLVTRGYDVTVIDRCRYPAMDTSFANGGQLSACNAEVWNSVSTILKGLKWMLRKDAPLLVNPMPSWHKYSWMAEFVAAIPHYRANTIETTRLAIAARQHLFSVAETENIDFDLEKRGILHIFHDKKSFDASARVNTLLTEGGLERHAVTPAEMRDIEPALMGSYFGGFFTPSDSTGDIHKFTRGLAEACQRRGVRFIQDAIVARIARAGGDDAAGFVIHYTPALPDAGLAPEQTAAEQDLKADAVVICAGAASRNLAASLGDRLNIYPVKGYSITVHSDRAESQAATPTVSLLDEAAKIVTSRLGVNRLRVAGTAEYNGFNRDIRADRIQPLIDWVRREFPAVDTDRAVPWTGLRPMMPDMMPRVRRGRVKGVFYNTGHGHLGWTLSAATAELIAEQVKADYPVA